MGDPGDNLPVTGQEDAGLSALARGLRLSFTFLIVAMIVAIIGFFLKSLFAVPQQDVGIVLRFGQLLRTVEGSEVREPGLRFTFPPPVDEKIVVPRTRLLDVESEAFWYTEAPPGATAEIEAVLRPGADGYMLTGDTNILHGRWSVRYRVSDPVKYAFRFRNPERDFASMRDFLVLLLNNAVTKAAATHGIDLAWGRKEEFRTVVQSLLADRVEALDMGIVIERVEAVGPVPPRQVQDAFQAITEARTARERLITEARSDRSRIVSDAEAEAAETVAAAQAEKTLTVEKLRADQAYFARLREQLLGGRGVILQTLYLDTLRQVLDQAENTFIIEGGENRELRLELNRPPTDTAEEDAE